MYNLNLNFIVSFVEYYVAEAFVVCWQMGCVLFRDSDRSLDIFDEKLHPLSVSMLMRFLQTQYLASIRC